MICPSCKAETGLSFFCHACDIYLSNPVAGAKAGVARRLAALLLDGFLVWVALLLFLAVAGFVGGAAQKGSEGSVSLSTFFWAIVGYTVFSLWFLAQGKTPGKWLVGIRAVDKSNGNKPGLGRMLVRETVGKFFSGLFFGLGYFWAIWDQDAQAWHDKIAGTLVLRRAHSIAPPIPASSSVSPARSTSLATPVNNSVAVAEKARPEQPLRESHATFCEHCGAKVAMASSFCEECGARIAEVVR